MEGYSNYKHQFIQLSRKNDDEFFEYPTAYYMRNALKCNDNIQYIVFLSY